MGRKTRTSKRPVKKDFFEFLDEQLKVEEQQEELRAPVATQPIRVQVPKDLSLRPAGILQLVDGQRAPVSEGAESELTYLRFEQLARVLGSDKLLVSCEDEVVRAIDGWLKQNEASEEQKDTLLSLIRYNFITRSMERSLKRNFLALPEPSSRNVESGNGCGRRAGFEHHVHLLWMETRGSKNGVHHITVSCVSWAKHLRKLKETVLASACQTYEREEDRDSVQYAVSRNKLIRTSVSARDDEIFISEVDFKSGKRTEKYSIAMQPMRVVDRPDVRIVKGAADLTLWYDDGCTMVRTVDTRTWKEEKPMREVPTGFGMHPFEVQFFEDFIIAQSGSSIVISGPQFEDPIAIEIENSGSRCVDFERSGDLLFVLEDRHSCKGMRDAIHVIDIKKKLHLTSVSLEEMFMEPDQDGFYASDPCYAVRFLWIDSELFVTQQCDSNMAVRFTSFNVRTFETEICAVIKAPEPQEGDPEGVYKRRILCAVSPRAMPCERNSLKDLGWSFLSFA